VSNEQEVVANNVKLHIEGSSDVSVMLPFVCDGWQNQATHVDIKFCVNPGKSATKTVEMLHEAFGEHSLSQTMVFQWHKCFKAGQVSG
jgi:hypothetical protein